MKERSSIQMAPQGPHLTAPLEVGTMDIDMADVEVTVTGMVYLFEICCDKCFAYYHCDLLNNYVMTYVLFSCVVRCTDVMSCVELFCVTYVLPFTDNIVSYYYLFMFLL